MHEDSLRSSIGLAVCVALSGCGTDHIGKRDTGPKGGHPTGTGGASAAGTGGMSGFANSEGGVTEPPTMFMRDAGMHTVRDAGDPDAALSSDNACGVGMAMA